MRPFTGKQTQAKLRKESGQRTIVVHSLVGKRRLDKLTKQERKMQARFDRESALENSHNITKTSMVTSVGKSIKKMFRRHQGR